jgi:chorismate mutase / prephenate dehydratase
MQKLLKLRNKIDDIDEKLQQLLNTRAAIAVEIIKVKQSSNEKLPHTDPIREQAILANIIKKNTGPLADETLTNIFKAIITACRATQEQII